MNISKISAYNYTSFGAKKSSHSYNGKHVKQSKTPSVGKIAGGMTLGTAAALAILVPSCQANKPVETPTEPTAIYGKTFATEATEALVYETTAPTVHQPVITTVLTTLPESQRKAKYHEVTSGDRLADIVKKYAELDPLTPDEELVPYYELLEADNPNKWTSRDKILIGTRIRVDSILPENTSMQTINRNENANTNSQIPVVEETLATEPIQETSAEDTININGNIFTFDLGTTKKTLLGDYEGLMFGQFVKLDKKMNGNVELTKYEGTTDESNKSQMLTYDKDGKIIELVNYENNQIVQTATYAYKMNSTIETITDNTAKSGMIDVITTDYDNSDDIINSREFSVDGKTVARFDFNTNSLQIGETTLTFDNGTFGCNDDLIGSKKYTALINGKEVRIDALKNGFCIEYIGTNGEIQSRDQFDAKGNLIYTE